MSDLKVLPVGGKDLQKNYKNFPTAIGLCAKIFAKNPLTAINN